MYADAFKLALALALASAGTICILTYLERLWYEMTDAKSHERNNPMSHETSPFGEPIPADTLNADIAQVWKDIILQGPIAATIERVGKSGLWTGRLRGRDDIEVNYGTFVPGLHISEARSGGKIVDVCLSHDSFEQAEARALAWLWEQGYGERRAETADRASGTGRYLAGRSLLGAGQY